MKTLLRRDRSHGSESSPLAVKNIVRNTLPSSLPTRDVTPKCRRRAVTPSRELDETSVRGGSLFSTIFRREAPEETSSASPDGPVYGSPRRRKKSVSADQLDSTLRRGMDKSSRVVHSMSSTQMDRLGRPPCRDPLDQSSRVSYPGASTSLVQQQPQQQQQSPCSQHTTALPVGLCLDEGDQAVDLSHIPCITPAYVPTSLRLSPHMNATDALSLSLSRRKKALVNFHNCADRHHAAYLGGSDEPSNHGADEDEDELALGAQGMHHGNWRSPVSLVTEHPDASLATTTVATTPTKKTQYPSPSTLSSSLSSTATLEAVPESRELGHQANSSGGSDTHALRPLVGVDTWQAGRRYLIAPAALAACPHGPASLLECCSYRPMEPCGPIAPGAMVILGNYRVTYTGDSCSSVHLVVWGNFLLEYRNRREDGCSAESSSRSCASSWWAPHKAALVGYAHLENAVARPSEEDDEAFVLDFYGSPCAKADRRRVQMQRCTRQDDSAATPLSRDDCVKYLNRAAGIKRIEDIYDGCDETEALGEGTYSSIRSVRRRQTQEPVALKVMDKKVFWQNVLKGRERADTLVREAAVQATLTAQAGHNSPFVRLRGFFETSEQVVLEMELLDGTDLFDYIGSRTVLAEPEAARLLWDLLKALVVMSEAGIAHRDIKPANILMGNQDTGGDVSIKVCDFGMAAFVGADGLVRGRCGTPGYVAPEIFGAGPNGGYENKVDVYSAGVTLYVMLCGYEPFYAETDAAMVEVNRQSELVFPEDDWESVSDEAKDLIRCLMATDPTERTTAREAMSHSWLTRHRRL